MLDLYPIVDVDTLEKYGLDPLLFAERVLRARPKLLQLRAKNSGARATFELLQGLLPLARSAGTALYANDRPDLAVLAACDGVHVGQDDLPPSAVKRFAPALRVGVSTHNLAQLDEALEANPDYVAFGPIFSTISKLRPDPVVGLALLERAANRAQRARCPIVAIGGITVEHAASIRQLGAIPAVIGALVPASGALEDVSERVAAFEHVLAS